MARKKEERNGPRALTPEAREEQMCALAVDLAEEKLRDGTAPSQIIVHYLKLASEKEKLEKQKLCEEVEMLKAKTAALESTKRIEELYAEAIDAMKLYSGSSQKVEEDYYEY